jgi:hypothetical protein
MALARRRLKISGGVGTNGFFLSEIKTPEE